MAQAHVRRVRIGTFSRPYPGPCCLF